MQRFVTVPLLRLRKLLHAHFFGITFKFTTAPIPPLVGKRGREECMWVTADPYTKRINHCAGASAECKTSVVIKLRHQKKGKSPKKLSKILIYILYYSTHIWTSGQAFFKGSFCSTFHRISPSQTVDVAADQ